MRHQVAGATLLPLALLLVPVGACGQGTDQDDARQAEAAEQAALTNVYGDSMPHPTVTLSTNQGDIRIELFPGDAPETVENFLAYVEDGHYDGLIFHRVIPNFMIQAGGHRPDMTMKEAERQPVRNESDNGLHNLRGTVAMARTPDPHSARAQFFINLVDNPNLDHGGTDGAWGYTVFGRVVEGMAVVDEIAAIPTGTAAGQRDVPRETIVIESSERGEDIQPGDD